jgi:hypothetical protein
VDNWTNKVDEEGEPIAFVNQWHFSGVTVQKVQRMRYLAVFQIRPDGSFEPVIKSENGTFAVGNWNIKAEMNTSKPANIQVWNTDNSASLVSEGVLTLNGKEYAGGNNKNSKLFEMVNGIEMFQEAGDEIPEAIQKEMNRKK